MMTIWDEDFSFEPLKINVITDDPISENEKKVHVTDLAGDLAAKLENIPTEVSQHEAIAVVQAIDDVQRKDYKIQLEISSNDESERWLSAVQGHYTVEIEGRKFDVPIFKPTASSAADEVQQRLTEVVEDCANIATLLTDRRIDSEKLVRSLMCVATEALSGCKSPDVRRRALPNLLLQLATVYKNMIIYKVKKEYQDADTKVDDLSDGIWVTPKTIPVASSTRYIVGKLKMNARSVDWLKTIVFSPHSLKTARAKFDLRSSITEDV